MIIPCARILCRKTWAGRHTVLKKVLSVEAFIAFPDRFTVPVHSTSRIRHLQYCYWSVSQLPEHLGRFPGSGQRSDLLPYTEPVARARLCNTGPA
jgi:hypothetical protein